MHFFFFRTERQTDLKSFPTVFDTRSGVLLLTRSLKFLQESITLGGVRRVACEEVLNITVNFCIVLSAGGCGGMEHLHFLHHGRKKAS